MTRTILTALIALALALPVFAAEQTTGQVETQGWTVFTDQYLAASGTANGTDINLGLNPRGSFALYVVTTGSGTTKFELRTSDDGSTWHTPSGSILGSSISDDIATTTAAGSHCFVFDAPLARHYRIIATEDGGAANATITSGELLGQ